MAIKDAWKDEAAEFTPWLAKTENLALLGDAIGVELELEAQEKRVGPFRADILCRDTASSRWVLVEDQIERTDHTHPGQTNGATVGVEEKLWAAADKMRGRMDQSVTAPGVRPRGAGGTA